jgi:transcriptional regulator with XRE-family HTH domain
MENPRSLGQFLKQQRTEAQLSLRELAEKVKVSAVFLSDIELGRRNPSPETLAELAKALKVTTDEFLKYDVRESASDLKRLVERNPAYGFAFRTALNEATKGNLSPDELMRRITKKK